MRTRPGLLTPPSTSCVTKESLARDFPPRRPQRPSVCARGSSPVFCVESLASAPRWPLPLPFFFFRSCCPSDLNAPLANGHLRLSSNIWVFRPSTRNAQSNCAGGKVYPKSASRTKAVDKFLAISTWSERPPPPPPRQHHHHQELKFEYEAVDRDDNAIIPNSLCPTRR